MTTGTQHGTLPPVPEKADLGQILLRDGTIRPEQLEECLRLQAEFAAQPDTPTPRLGEILVQRGYVTPDAVAQALSEQAKKILHCPRCAILVNVDLRPDATGYHCGRCQGPLADPPPGQKDKCSDTAIIIKSALPVPPEVEKVREEPARCFGKYVLLGIIGRGGIADVYRAWDTFLHQYVALKRLQALPEERPDARHTRVVSLLNEAHNMIRLRHPNIVSVYDIGRIGKVYYISMEYLDGRTMYDEIKSRRDTGHVSSYHEDPEKWLGVFFQVAHAVHYAHTRPVPLFHCDLKPGNVFVTREGRVCVLDFGLARQLGEFHTDYGLISGTPSYMSPEQAMGRSDQVDSRTDIYGLGSTLYELLTGRPPFSGELGEVLHHTIKDRPAPPSEVLRAAAGSKRARLVPPELEALCLSCLEKDRSRRPQTALAVAEEIERIVGAGKILPPLSESTTQLRVPPPTPIPAPAHPGRPVTRRAGVAALVAVLLALAAWGWWMGGPFSGGPEARELSARTTRHLGAFRPDLVRELEAGLRARAEHQELLFRTEAIAAFKQRLIAEVIARKPVMPELRVGPRSLKEVKVCKAKAENVLFLVGNEPDEASWSELGAAGIAALARACGLLKQPEDRYGLALYCLCAGATGEARGFLDSLRGTPLEAASLRYSRELR